MTESESTRPTIEAILGSNQVFGQVRLQAEGPSGRLPITPEMLLNEPSGNLFGLTQNAGMGWSPADVTRPQYLILSTQGGLRNADGQPEALGYHTGHWEIDSLVRQAARTFKAEGVIPFAAYCSDPCDGRTQGTSGMFDSLPYRNDAAIVLRRLIRSLPQRQGVMGIATCDKGLPAMMLGLAGCKDLPGIIVPGGVTLPAVDAEDAGTVQTIGARFAHKMIDLDYAASMGCRACGTPGGGCQFLGTAATSQVVAEALGIALPHSALSPSGESVWLDVAHRSALALLRLTADRLPLSSILTGHAVENAMIVHAAFGGSTNLLLHIPAIAHAAGLPMPEIEDWQRINRLTPRLVDALPNGPRNHPTVHVFAAGGVPEVMLHLRHMGLLNLDVITSTGESLSEVLDWWEQSERRQAAKRLLEREAQIDPEQVIMDADSAKRAGLSGTLVFPVGNIAPQGSVIKATALDPTLVDHNGIYRHRGSARVFVSERDAIEAIKGLTNKPVRPGEVVVLVGGGPVGTGMEETYQVTSALKFIPWGKTVPVLTDARFSGVSTGACIGHIAPEALTDGPIGKLCDGDLIEIIIDCRQLKGSISFLGTLDQSLPPDEAEVVLNARPLHPQLQAHSQLSDDTRLWAALQRVSGGVWAGCVYDVERIIRVIDTGLSALSEDG